MTYQPSNLCSASSLDNRDGPFADTMQHVLEFVVSIAAVRADMPQPRKVTDGFNGDQRCPVVDF